MMKWTSCTENATRNALDEQQAVRKSQQKESKISGQIVSAKVQNGDRNLLNGELVSIPEFPPTPIGIPLRIHQFDATVAKLTILHPLYTILYNSKISAGAQCATVYSGIFVS